jgi:hypothetical protein
MGASNQAKKDENRSNADIARDLHGTLGSLESAT